MAESKKDVKKVPLEKSRLIKMNIETLYSLIRNRCDNAKVPAARGAYQDVLNVLDRMKENEVKNSFNPPCYIDDVLFCIFSDKGMTEEVNCRLAICKVTDILYMGNETYIIGVKEIDNSMGHNVRIGMDAFYTVEEAEEKFNEVIEQ